MCGTFFLPWETEAVENSALSIALKLQQLFSQIKTIRLLYQNCQGNWKGNNSWKLCCKLPTTYLVVCLSRRSSLQGLPDPQSNQHLTVSHYPVSMLCFQSWWKVFQQYFLYINSCDSLQRLQSNQYLTNICIYNLLSKLRECYQQGLLYLSAAAMS